MKASATGRAAASLGRMILPVGTRAIGYIYIATPRHLTRLRILRHLPTCPDRYVRSCFEF